MVLNGNLLVKVHRVEGLPVEVEDAPKSLSGYNYVVKFTIAGDSKATKAKGKGHAKKIDQELDFLLTKVKESESVVIDVLHENSKVLTSGSCSLKELIDATETEIPLSQGKKLHVSYNWTPVPQAASTAAAAAASTSSEAVNKVSSTVSGALSSPQTSLTVKDTHRPPFMRVAYYYDTTKSVYNYTTSIRGISSVARFGESAANKVLTKVSGKDLHSLDASVVVPLLDSLDNKVDETISTVLQKIVQGQDYLLKQKDVVVDKASSVAKNTQGSVSKIARGTMDTVSAAQSRVSGVSSTAFGTVRAAAFDVISHLPVLGARVRT